MDDWKDKKFNMGVKFRSDIAQFKREKKESKWFSKERKLAKKKLETTKFYRRWAENIMKSSMYKGTPIRIVRGALYDTYVGYFEKMEELDDNSIDGTK